MRNFAPIFVFKAFRVRNFCDHTGRVMVFRGDDVFDAANLRLATGSAKLVHYRVYRPRRNLAYRVAAHAVANIAYNERIPLAKYDFMLPPRGLMVMCILMRILESAM